MLSLTLIVLFFITLGLIWWFNKEEEDEIFKPIPGPRSLPILGNLLQVGNELHLKFYEWADKYGDIFQVKLGSKRAVVISDPKLIKEIFSVDPAFAGRQFFEGFEMYPNEVLGILGTEGELWEVHRRFLLRQLRDFGFGKSTMEQLILEEVKETIDRFKAAQGKTLSNTKQIFQIAVINSLWTIVSSERFEHDDPKLNEMLNDAAKFTEELTRRSILFLIPWTKYFLPKLKGFEEMRDRNRKFYEDTTNRHKATYKEENVRDFVDVYLKEMNDRKNEPDSMFYGARAERQLNVLLADIFFAGTDTTSTTLSWTVLYLATNENVQQKMQHEIKEITGNTRPVTLSDRNNMPYTNAVMEETFRLSSIVPNGVQHRAIIGKRFKGHYIPKDTWIFPNLWHLHRNPKTWGDPENFRPERFLSDDEKTFKKSENVMPFVIGRRQCPGEMLARDTFFLFLTNVFQTFSISLDPKFPKPSLEPHFGLVLAPQDYHVILKEQ